MRPSRARGRQDGIRRGLYGALLAVTSLAAGPAYAQAVGSFLEGAIPPTADRGRNVSVIDRERPEYEAQGIGLGGFVLYPEVEAGVGYSDNVFNTETNRQDDFYLALDPQFRLESRWSNHELRVAGGAELRRFADQSLRNQSGLFTRIDGRFDISRDTNVIGFAQARRAYQAQFSSSVPDNAIQPAEFVQASAGLRGQHRANRWRAIVAADINDFDFRDVALTNSARLDQDFRDRTVLRGAGRLEYGVTPDASVFGEVDLSSIDHRQDRIGSQPNRDGDEVRALLGISFDLSALVRAQIGGGYIRRGFEARDVYPRISDFAYDLRLEYFLSELTTISVAAVRSIEESVITTSSGYVANTFELRADHELLRNLILSAAGAYQYNRFKGLDRSDEVVSLRGEGTYLLSSTVGVRAGVRYLDRDSSGPIRGQTFDEVQAIASLILRR
jgi:hypothetical protein